MDNRAKLEETLPLVIKQSTELLNLRKIEETLAKKKKYQDAHHIQTRADKLHAKETEQHLINREKKILQSEATLMQKQ